jgi:hypothetical protein
MVLSNSKATFARLKEPLMQGIVQPGYGSSTISYTYRIIYTDTADRPLGYLNGVIERLSAEYNVPLLNLRRVVNALPDHGCTADGFHYSTPPDGRTADFTGSHLNYGFPARNLTALQALEALRSQVLRSIAGDAIVLVYRQEAAAAPVLRCHVVEIVGAAAACQGVVAVLDHASPRSSCEHALLAPVESDQPRCARSSRIAQLFAGTSESWARANATSLAPKPQGLDTQNYDSRGLLGVRYLRPTGSLPGLSPGLSGSTAPGSRPQRGSSASWFWLFGIKTDFTKWCKRRLSFKV